MRILVGQNHLDTLGGSETYTYALVEELVRQGHEVRVVCMPKRKGFVAYQIFENFGIEVNHLNGAEFDLALISHNSIFNLMAANKIAAKKTFQICHGTTPPLEQPCGHPGVEYISISEEVRDHVLAKGHESTVIRNGINTDKFSQTSINQELKNVLSLSQSERLNAFLSKVCKRNGWEFDSFNKFKNPVFEIHEHIQKADMVVTLGRGAYESMSCGKNVLIADFRQYQSPMMDGLLTPENIDNIIKNNCSGRANRLTITEATMTEQFNKYDIAYGEANRQYALENLNIQNQVKKMIDIK
jgi:glycosyltransferase involved in cell wall biosynthesis